MFKQSESSSRQKKDDCFFRNCTGKYELVFLVTQENAFKANRKTCAPLKIGTREF